MTEYYIKTKQDKLTNSVNFKDQIRIHHASKAEMQPSFAELPYK